MQKAEHIIKSIAEQSNRAILFHSASGKDSIALLDLLSPYFKEVVCVFMYVVKDLEHINRYINYARSKYRNVTFIQIPHFAVFSYKKNGYLGCEQSEVKKVYNLADLTDLVRQQYKIDWAFYGFKQSDSMNRRLMLKTYKDEAINEEQKKCYPLSSYKNSDILAYIENRGLVKPESYGKAQSSGTNISDINYLLWLRENFPNDLRKVISEYPLTERILFEYDYEQNNKAE